jgi:hypothetical protein
MPDFNVNVPFYPPAGALPQLIATQRPDYSWIGNLPDAYWAGQQQGYQRNLQTLFQKPGMIDAQGNINWQAALPEIARQGGVPELGNILMGTKVQLGSQLFGQGQPGQNVDMPPRADNLPPSTSRQVGQDSGRRYTPRQLQAANVGPAQEIMKTFGVASIDTPINFDQPGPKALLAQYRDWQAKANRGDLVGPPPTAGAGTATGPVAGAGPTQGQPQQVAQPTLTGQGPFLPGQVQGQQLSPGAFTGTAGDILPSAAQPMQYQHTGAQGLPSPPQLSTGQPSIPTGASTEQRAQAYEDYARRMNLRADQLEFVGGPGAGAGARADAAQASEYAKTIRGALSKNVEATEKEKNARAAGMSVPEYDRYQKWVELDSKNASDEAEGIRRAGETAVTGVRYAQAGKQMTQMPGFYSGAWGKEFQNYQQFKSLFGDTTAAFPTEAMEKVVNGMLNEQIKALGQSHVGRVLAMEVQNMRKQIASLGTTEVTNRALFELSQRTYQRAMGLTDLVNGLPPNITSAQLSRQVLNYLNTNPVIKSNELGHLELLGSKEPPPESARWSPAQRREWGRQNGLKPGDPIMFNGDLRQIP